MNLTLCKEIRHIDGAYIVKMRYPAGVTRTGFGVVICSTIEGVLEVIEMADVDPIRRREKVGPAKSVGG